MVLLNITQSKSDYFNSILKDIEEKSGINFVLLYSINGAVTQGYLDEMIALSIEEGTINKDDAICPVILGGYLFEKDKAEIGYAPAFSPSREYLKEVPRGKNITYFKRPNTVLPDKVKPIITPADSIFGDIHLPKEDSKNKYPIASIYFSILEIKEGEYKDKMFKYIFEYIAHTITEGFPMPVFIEPEKEIDEKDTITKIVDSLSVRKKEAERQYQKSKEKLELLRKDMMDECLKMDRASETIAHFQDDSHIKSQIEIIRNHPDVIWFECTSNTFKFMTSRIEIEDEIEGVPKRYAIGHIIIKVNLTNGDVSFDNVTRRVRGLGSNPISSHPHDASGQGGTGSMCLGITTEHVPKLLNKLELLPLVQLLINFARSVNYKDVAGRTIVQWPELELEV